MKVPTPLSFLAVLLVLCAAAAPAQPLDLQGNWQLTVNSTVFPAGAGTADLPDKGVAVDACTHQGTATLTQDGTDFSGSATLMLIDGSPMQCPEEMMATISGSEVGGDISGTLTSAEFGTADFDGSSLVKVRGDKATGTLAGTYLTTGGGPLNGNGTWVAVARATVLDIPTLGPFGLTLLALIVLTAGAFLLRRRMA